MGINLIEVLSTKRKADVKKLVSELYFKHVPSYYVESREGFILQVGFKDLVKAIQVLSEFIEENDIKVQLRSLKYWEVHAKDFYNSRNDDFNFGK